MENAYTTVFEGLRVVVLLDQWVIKGSIIQTLQPFGVMDVEWKFYSYLKLSD